MPLKLTRRTLLRGALGLGAVAAGAGAYEAARQALDLKEQHDTWVEASRPNTDFLARHEDDVARLTIGASFAPEQWGRRSQDQALPALDFAVRGLDMRQMRLGLRWNRSIDREGRVDLAYYRPYLDYCMAGGVDVCLNVGPIRTFRWPEEHVPSSVLASLPKVPVRGATIRAGDVLAQRALDYLEHLLDLLRREYGGDLGRRVRLVHVENEGFYPLGKHEWTVGRDYVAAAVRCVDAAMPTAGLLLTSASRLNLDDIQGVFSDLLADGESFRGRLVSGFDYHYKTPLRDSKPIARYFDQISYSQPFTPPVEENIRRSRAMGYRIEVTEAQMEPYGHLTSPGNSARDLRFVLLRCMDKVLDPELPALIRVWGIEELSKRVLRGEATQEHRQMVELIQAINASKPVPAEPAGASRAAT